MKEIQPKQTMQDVPKEDSFAARALAQGFTLVPCWVTREDGQRVRGCKWVKILSRA